MNMHAAVFSTTDMAFDREPLARLREDGLDAMLHAHWAEVAHDQEAIALNPDWDRYYRIEASGDFVAYGVRKAGELIGYTAFFINRSLHYRDHIFALNDVVFVQKQHRGLDGVVLILESEVDLRRQGVSKVFYHAKTDAFLGDTDGDSLAALERMMELEAVYGIEIPDDLAVVDSTLGQVLAAIGYRHVEDTYGKLLGERG